MSRLLRALSVVPLMVGGILVVGASAANATPVSCSNTTSFGSIGGTGRLRAEGVGSCSTSAGRTFVTEIKWNKNLAPDPLTAKSSQYGSRSYYIDLRACDGGNTRGYYGRSYWTVDVTYVDTPAQVIKTCV